MGCGSCGTGGCSSKGCGQNGGCATGGCNKLNTYDWLNNMLPPEKSEVDNVYEVRFKGTRKGFYRNVNGLRLYIGDHVVVESDRGYDIGTLSLGGVLAELQMRKKRFRKQVQDLPKIYRKANEGDLELKAEAHKREQDTLVKSREIVNRLELDMKVSDIEFQADNTKAIFYYIADHRVDFRALIKELAREFRIRVEMKQIGLRHEAGLLGGIGSCGRELCCSTWLTDFQTVSTSAARYQNLSLNPMKISGLCGRLKCCLNYELDAYMDALEDFPEVKSIITQKGKAWVQKTDIFKETMWFSFEGETTWYPLHISAVKEILKLNQKGEKPEVFAEGSKLQFSGLDLPDPAASIDFVDGVGTTILKEDPRRSRNKKGRNRKKGKGPRGQSNQGGKGQKGPQSRSGQGQKEGEGQSRNRNQSNRRRNKGGNQRQAGGGNPEAKSGAEKQGGNKQGGNKRQRPPRSNRRNQPPKGSTNE